MQLLPDQEASAQFLCFAFTLRPAKDCKGLQRDSVLIYVDEKDIFVKRSRVQVTQINEATIKNGWPNNAE